ncbi:hypothetical protein H206_05422 [Candidatus Electrothrix aarhusensis]|uniref:Uncharacterized protein n=1 Tax=Candidatus Electrothrix aarhusensis TaxID=1859131 RepID=A0A444J4G8_9BACT|nr:hypothetical protein H206_05422 [Candidatus Electrothrix aarhusensis]
MRRCRKATGLQRGDSRVTYFLPYYQEVIMRIPHALTNCIGRLPDWPIRLSRHSIKKTTIQFFRSCRCGRFSSELIPAFTFQQGKPVPVRVDIRRFR